MKTRIHIESNSTVQHFILKRGPSKNYHRLLTVETTKESHYQGVHLILDGAHNKTSATINLKQEHAKQIFMPCFYQR